MKSWPLIAVAVCAALAAAALPAGAQGIPDVPIGTHPACLTPAATPESQPTTTPQISYLLSFPSAWIVSSALAWSSSSRVPLSNRVSSAVVREPQRGSLRLGRGSWARVIHR